jgi:hypothetical protein
VLLPAGPIMTRRDDPLYLSDDFSAARGDLSLR